MYLDCTKTYRNKLRIFFFVSFYSASCLSLGDLVQRCLGQPVDLLAPSSDLQRLCYLADGRLLFIFNLSNAESRGTWKAWRTFAWMNWLSCGDTNFFFLMLTRRRRGLEERETKFSAGVTATAPTAMHAEERQRECSQRHSEVRAGRLSTPCASPISAPNRGAAVNGRRVHCQ